MSKNLKIVFIIFLAVILACTFIACTKTPDNGEENNGNNGGGNVIDNPVETQPVVTFNSNGGSIVESISVVAGSVISAPRAPMRSGYVFAGWYKENTLVTPYTFSVMPSKSLTLYAKWTVASNDNVNIDDADGLRAIANNLSGRYSLTADIDLNGEEWLPIGIGTGINSFSGILDGNGFTVSNFKITTVEANNKYVGFFGYISGNVEEFILSNFSIDITVNSDCYVGGIAGFVQNTTETNGVIGNSSVTGTINVINSSSVRPIFAGGIAGKVASGTVSNCISAMQMDLVSNNLYGGILVGDNGSSSTVESCVGSGNISSSYLAEYQVSSPIYSEMDVDRSFKVYAGGLIGYNGGSVLNSNASSEVYSEVDFNYSYGRINGKLLFNAITMAYSGGLIGCSIGNVKGSFASGNVTAKTNNILSFDFIAERVLTAEEINEGLDLEDEMKYKDKVCLSGSAYAGGLVGENGGDFDGYTSSELSECYSTGTVFTDNQVTFAVNTIEPYIQLDIFNYAYSGGLIGFARSSSLVSKSYSTSNCKTSANSDFDNCSYDEAFNEYCIYSGGFIGYNCGEISVCYATGSSESTMLQDFMYLGDKEKKNKKYSYKAFSGGFAGLNKYIITESYAIGDSVATSYGDVLSNSEQSLSRTNGYNQYFAYAGGFVGQNNEAIINSCFATGNATAKTGLINITESFSVEVEDTLGFNKYDSYAGTFAGEKYSDKSVCSYDFSVPDIQTVVLSANTLLSDAYSVVGNTDKTLEQLKLRSNLETYLKWTPDNWNFSLTHSEGYPTIV